MCKKRWIVQKEDKVKKKEDKQQTIPQIIEEVKTKMCDEYCKYPDVLPEDVLWSTCEQCPLGRLG